MVFMGTGERDGVGARENRVSKPTAGKRDWRETSREKNQKL